MMTDDIGVIAVGKVTEHEDGSGTWECHFDADTRDKLAEHGLTLVLHCAAAEMDIQEVFDWISSKVVLEENKTDEVRSDD